MSNRQKRNERQPQRFNPDPKKEELTVVSRSGVQKFIDEHQERLLVLWDKFLDLLDASDVPLFRQDEQEGAFPRFVKMLVHKFLLKVRIVDSDDSDGTESGDDEEEEDELDDEDEGEDAEELEEAEKEAEKVEEVLESDADSEEGEKDDDEEDAEEGEYEEPDIAADAVQIDEPAAAADAEEEAPKESL